MQAGHIGQIKGVSWLKGSVRKSILFLLFFSFLVVGCSLQNPLTTQIQTQSVPHPPTQIPPSSNPPTETHLPEPSVTPTLSPKQLWIPEYIPGKLRDAIRIPEGYVLADSATGADIALSVAEKDTTAPIQWVYALVAPFPTVTDGITADELQAAWEGTPPAVFSGAPLLMDESTLQVLSDYWGNPAAEVVETMAADELLDYAWSHRPAWAIIPFEALNPRWKVLTIEGTSPIRKDFDLHGYAVSIPFVLSGDSELINNNFEHPLSNWETDKLTTVAMTGVTAMVRATANTMERYGITYPAEEIGGLLAGADITHISNEIPFSPDCPFPQPISSMLIFCSNPKYLDLLKAVGTDVIELTGDHFMDYGADATLYTLKMYDEAGLPYYGGGADAESARQPVLFENNGNKIAFMGCNIGCEVKTSIPCTALATQDHPGAAKCDFDWIESEIPKLRQDGYQVIFSFQHIEYYKYTIEPVLEQDFTRVAEAGAAIVSGSQAHQPHGFAFDNEAYIHYGLGNLFFDQYHFCAYYACDDAFIDQHVFYDGQYIGTELITIRFVDYAKPRLMTSEERSSFLETMFAASGW